MIVADSLLTYILLVLLVIGATLRMTRFVTTDTLGEWLIVGPLRRWASAREEARRFAGLELVEQVEGEDLTPGARRLVDRIEDQLHSREPMSWQARLVSGADCPFCWGFWVGAIITTLTVVLVPIPTFGLIWVGLLAVLTLNYVVGHISSRIDV